LTHFFLPNIKPKSEIRIGSPEAKKGVVISAKVDPANAAFRVDLFFKALKVRAIKIAGKIKTNA
jgi:hypothetical protein